MNAFDFGGPWEPRAGWEHSAQAATGMQSVRSANGRPRAVPVPINDYVTGIYAATGVVFALRLRLRIGRGALVRASLARSASITMRHRRSSTIPSGETTPEYDADAIRDLLRDQRILRRWRHPELGWLEQLAPRIPADPPLDRAGWPAPQPGADAARVLARIDEDVDRLTDAGIVHPKWDLTRGLIGQPTQQA